jgi:UDP-N-acetylmuramoyl-tripeptide--D-alanyl-D-alanine ligase
MCYEKKEHSSKKSSKTNKKKILVISHSGSSIESIDKKWYFFKRMFSFSFISQVLYPEKLCPQNLENFEQITIDTRKIVPHSLFVAIDGEKNAHVFLEEAVQKGATGVIAKKDDPFTQKLIEQKKCSVFAVEDPLVALSQIASAWRKRFSLPVFAVGGSSGKTTTKEMLSALLSEAYPDLVKTEKSENGFLGIPLTLLRIRPTSLAAVIEIGIDDIGAMHQHVNQVQPTAGLLTLISEEHLSGLKDIDTVAQEEIALLTYLFENQATVALNWDDVYIQKAAKAANFDLKKTAAYSFDTLESSNLPFSCYKGAYDEKQSILTVLFEKKEMRFICPLEGKHNAKNLLAAVSLALQHGLSYEQIQKGLKNFSAPENRSHVTEQNGIKIIADYYNAQPSSMKAAFELTKTIYEKNLPSQCWFALADMLELADASERLHRELADPILKANFLDGVFLYGPMMGFLKEELEKKGYAHCFHTLDKTDFANQIQKQVKKNALLLLKGSRGMKLESIFLLLAKA